MCECLRVCARLSQGHNNALALVRHAPWGTKRADNARLPTSSATTMSQQGPEEGQNSNLECTQCVYTLGGKFELERPGQASTTTQGRRGYCDDGGSSTSKLCFIHKGRH